MSKLAYLVDMFFHLNKLNTSQQGFCTTKLRNKTDAFKKKLVLRNSSLQKVDTVMVSTLNDFWRSADASAKESLYYAS